MPTPRTKGASARSSQSTVTRSANALRAAARARGLVNLLLRELARGVRDPQRCGDAVWNQRFGAKQSMVANLHKLIVTLAMLDGMEQVAHEGAFATEKALTAEEKQWLKLWLAEDSDAKGVAGD